MVFDLHANGISTKISDFGLCQLDKDSFTRFNISTNIVKDTYRDYFSILYDIYNGGNLGGKSLHSLIKNKNKLDSLDKYFNQFINIKTIKQIIKNNKKEKLDWDWSKMIDLNLVKLFKMKQPLEYLKHFEQIYPYDKNHEIIEEYGL
jgi:hypothetical protein